MSSPKMIHWIHLAHNLTDVTKLEPMHSNWKNSKDTSAWIQACFHVKSSIGRNQIFTLCNYNSNVILVESIKSTQTDHLIQGCDTSHKRLADAGIKPILHRLDNEISKDLFSSKKSKKTRLLTFQHMCAWKEPY